MNPGTLNQISNPVTGWSSITNPAAQFQQGVNEEIDSVYALRQPAEVASLGSCSPSATVAALYALANSVYGSALSVFIADVLENTGDTALTVSGVGLPPHSMAVVIFDEGGELADEQIAQTIYANKPAGTQTVAIPGGGAFVLNDPVVGDVTIYWTTVTPRPLYITASISPYPAYAAQFSDLAAAVQTALVAAAVAPTPVNGAPPVGQLQPGSAVAGMQLATVILSVPGVYDVPVLKFDFVPSPTNTGLLTLAAFQVATISAVNITLTQAGYPS